MQQLQPITTDIGLWGWLMLGAELHAECQDSLGACAMPLDNLDFNAAQTELRRQAADKLEFHMAEIGRWSLVLQRLDEVGKALSDTADAVRRENASHQTGGPSAGRAERSRNAPTSGLVFDTASFVRTYMIEHDEGLKTRDLLPIVQAGGIEVGGKNPIATLSARLHSSQLFEHKQGRWVVKRDGTGPVAVTPLPNTLAD